MKKIIFEKIDCLRLFVPDLEKGIEFYHKQLGLPIRWKTNNEVGFLLGDGVGELVIQNKDKWEETDLKVGSVLDVVKKIRNSGGKIVVEPFDIKIGKCAVVEDLWKNKLVILDSTKGFLATNKNKEVIGLNKNKIK